jgi:hypothetical protein
MSFLFRRLDPAEVRSALVIQTCNHDLFGHVVADARRRFTSARIGVVIQRGMSLYLPPLPVDETWENLRDERSELVGILRKRRFDVVCIVGSGERGFWKLKLLPLLLGAKSVWLYDRHARPKPLSLAQLGDLARGLFGGFSYRLDSRRLLAPVTFWRLWRFYRRRKSLGPPPKEIAPAPD